MDTKENTGRYFGVHMVQYIRYIDTHLLSLLVSGTLVFHTFSLYSSRACAHQRNRLLLAHT